MTRASVTSSNPLWRVAIECFIYGFEAFYGQPMQLMPAMLIYRTRNMKPFAPQWRLSSTSKTSTATGECARHVKLFITQAVTVVSVL